MHLYSSRKTSRIYQPPTDVQKTGRGEEVPPSRLLSSPHQLKFTRLNYICRHRYSDLALGLCFHFFSTNKGYKKAFLGLGAYRELLRSVPTTAQHFFHVTSPYSIFNMQRKRSQFKNAFTGAFRRPTIIKTRQISTKQFAAWLLFLVCAFLNLHGGNLRLGQERQGVTH